MTLISSTIPFGFYDPSYFTNQIAVLAAGVAFVVATLMFLLRFNVEIPGAQKLAFAIAFGTMNAVVAALFTLVLFVGEEFRPILSEILIGIASVVHVCLMWTMLSHLKEKVAHG